MKKTGMIRKSTLARFGVTEPGTYNSKLHKTMISDIADGIENQYQMAIVGQFGAGKSQLMHMLKASYNNTTNRPLFIHIVSPDKKRLNIGSVVEAMIIRLDVKDAGRSVNVKTINLITALGSLMTKGSGRHVCLVIDNAHRCDIELFSEIRDLREQDFNGISPLFSVLFIGQEGLESKLNKRKEVGKRTQFYFMTQNSGWWSFEERENYVESVFGSAITPGARQNIAAKTSVPLEIDCLVGDSMEAARTAGFKVVDEQVVPATEQEILAGKGISYSEVADIAGVSKTSVSNFIKGESQTPATKKKISSALENLIKKDNPQRITG